MKGQRLTLAVSGMLWNRSLVMVDKQTGSLWSHILGEAMHGPLKGTELEVLPSTITDWATWRSAHPDTSVLVMSRTARGFTTDYLRDLSRFVLGMDHGAAPRAWPLEELAKEPVVNTSYDGKPILVFFDKRSRTPVAYSRKLGQRTLTFELRDGQLVDAQTGSAWDWRAGRALKGPLKGQSLAPVVSIISFRRAWKAFHPKSSFFRASESG